MIRCSHIFFDLHGTLVNGAQLHPCYSLQLGRIMAARFGKTPQVWTSANRAVLADWDSYYADLDLNGEHGMEDLWEGLLRTTRGMFRLAGVPEPDRATLVQLSRELPGLSTRVCDALFPDSRGVIRRLYQAGFTLGITSHALASQAHGLLLGGGILPFFAGPIVGPDTVGRFRKDEMFFGSAARLAAAVPEACLAVDDDPDCLAGAQAAGMQTLQIVRREGIAATCADVVLHGSLKQMLPLLGVTGE